MNLEIGTRQLRPMSVISVAGIGPYDVTAAEAWEHLKLLLARHGARNPHPPVFALLRDLPHEVRPEQRRLEMCAVVDDATLEALRHEARVVNFPGGTFVTTRHFGSYDQIPRIFSQLYAACSLDMSMTLDLKRPRVVIFAGDPTARPPEDLAAELCMPVTIAAPMPKPSAA